MPIWELLPSNVCDGHNLLARIWSIQWGVSKQVAMPPYLNCVCKEGNTISCINLLNPVHNSMDSPRITSSLWIGPKALYGPTTARVNGRRETDSPMLQLPTKRRCRQEHLWFEQYSIFSAHTKRYPGTVSPCPCPHACPHACPNPELFQHYYAVTDGR